MMKLILTTDVFDLWFKKLRDKVAKAKIKTRIDRLEMGNAGDAKPIGRGISEMRIHTGAGYRVYFIDRGFDVIVLLCGGDKKRQQKDIEKAKTMAKELQEDDFNGY